MPRVTGPHIRDLTREESFAILGAGNVGRIAFTLHDRVDIAPINYVRDGQWIFGRTSTGAKLGMLLHNPWCAFETDEVRGLFDWTSVVSRNRIDRLCRLDTVGKRYGEDRFPCRFAGLCAGNTKQILHCVFH